MPSLTHTTSPILSALRATRSKTPTSITFRPTTAFQSPTLRNLQIRNLHAGMVSSKVINGARADWGSQWKKQWGIALMYFPVIGVVMFWPYVVEPVMAVIEG